MDIKQDYLAQGQSALDSGDWASAKTYFETALQDHEYPEAYDGLGIALWWLNTIDASHEMRTAAFVAYKKRGEFRKAARIAMWLAREHVFLNANRSAMNGWFAQAERLLKQVGKCPEWGWLDLFRASIIATPAELHQVGREAARTATEFGDINLEAIALAFCGLAMVTTGEVNEGMDTLDETMVLAVSGEVTDFMTISEVFCVMLSACEVAGDWARANQWCDTANAYAERHRCPFLSAYCRTTYGGVLTATGQWKSAEQTLIGAIRGFESGHRALRIHALLKLAELRISQGRLEEAEALLIGCEDYGDATLPLARLHLARSEPQLALTLLEQSLSSSRASTLYQVPLMLLLAETYLTLDNFDDAQRTIEQAVVLTQRAHSDSLAAQILLVKGKVKRAVGEKDAVECFRAALNHLKSYEQSLLAGRARLEMALTLKETDDVGAVTWARAAYATFMRLDVPHHADEALKLLRELGVSARPVQRTNEILTQREAEVLVLIRRGLTNREIGERLFVSAKTVEHHVSRILSKLGVRNRAEAVALATNEEQH